MKRDELAGKARTLLGRVKYPAVGLVAAFLLLLAFPFVAPMAFGPRGDLLALLVEWSIEMMVGGVFALLFGFLFITRPKGILKWVFFLALLLFGGVCLFSAWEVGRTTADLVLPFKERDVVVVKTYYEHYQTGRGAVPESGGWHLVTADGDDHLVRASGDGDRLRPGSYRIQFSYFKNVVMAAEAR